MQVGTIEFFWIRIFLPGKVKEERSSGGRQERGRKDQEGTRKGGSRKQEKKRGIIKEIIQGK